MIYFVACLEDGRKYNSAGEITDLWRFASKIDEKYGPVKSFFVRNDEEPELRVPVTMEELAQRNIFNDPGRPEGAELIGVEFPLTHRLNGI